MYAVIEELSQKRFRWGEDDCCLFVGRVVQAFTGVDLAASFRGKYRSQKGAASRIRRAGSLEKLVDEVTTDHGLREVPVGMAARGDIILFPSVLGETLGICDGHQIITMGKDGVVAFPMEAAMKAWGV